MLNKFSKKFTMGVKGLAGRAVIVFRAKKNGLNS